jgi:uncharacterized protein (TIRG00374 family)
MADRPELPSGGAAASRTPKPHMPRAVGTVAKLVVTAAVVAYVIHKFGWRHIVATCGTIKPLYALCGIFATVVSIALGAYQWHLLLHRKDLRLTFRESFELYYIGMFFNNIGTVAGDGIKVAYIRKRHQLGKIGFAATFLDRFAGLLALSIFAAIGCGVLLRQGTFDNARVLLLVRITAILFALFLCMLAFLTMRRLRKFFFVVIERLHLPKREFISDLVAVTALDVNHLPLIIKIAVLSFVIQGLRIAVHIFSAAAFGIPITPVNIVYFFIFVPLVALVMIIPLPLGIRETIGGNLFSLIGIPKPVAILMQFMATLIGIAGSLWGGVEFLINMPRGVHAKHPQPESADSRQ